MRLSVKGNKNALFSCCCRPPKDITKNLSNYPTKIFEKVENVKKKFYNEDNNIKSFYDKLCEHGFSPLIGKPTRIYKTDETIIYNIITNWAFDYPLTLVRMVVSKKTS